MRGTTRAILAMTAGAVLALLVAYTAAHAGPLARIYDTNTSSGYENSAVVTTQPVLLKVIEACNKNTTTALTAMIFDASSLPANGVNSRFCDITLAVAPSSTTETCGTCLIGADGIQVLSGIVLACSTTAANLTVDTTSGGDCKFHVAY